MGLCVCSEIVCVYVSAPSHRCLLLWPHPVVCIRQCLGHLCARLHVWVFVFELYILVDLDVFCAMMLYGAQTCVCVCVCVCVFQLLCVS
jgi:hypothetical protein